MEPQQLNFSSLPQTLRVTMSARPGDIAHALESIARNLAYRHWTIAHGAPSSVRVFCPVEYGFSLPYENYASPHDLAKELSKLAQQSARYPEPQPPKTVKGWEIRRGYITGNIPIAVAIATWVEAPKGM